MDRDRILTIAMTALATIALLALGGLLYIQSGAYNVAATSGHVGTVRWALRTVMEESVRERRDRVPEPPPADSSMLLHGFEHFQAMCVVCHGAPGAEPGEIGKGLLPDPPALSEVADDWTDREIFWIVKHGIKMSGMPAFGPTHSDEEIWGITNFVRRLPGMSAEEYQEWVGRLTAERDAAGAEEGHTHAPGAPAHEH